MAGIHQSDFRAVQINRAAFVKADHRQTIALFIPSHQIVDADKRHVQFLRDGQRITCVVAVAMGQQHMGCPLQRGTALIFWQQRVAGQPRVHQQHGMFDFDGSDTLFSRIEADYDLIRQAVLDGKSLSGSMGELIQPRTKGAGGMAPKTRAFYARTGFLASIFMGEFD